MRNTAISLVTVSLLDRHQDYGAAAGTKNQDDVDLQRTNPTEHLLFWRYGSSTW